MRIKRLVLKNFRNYSHLSWIPHPCLNIVSGNNAQGKTNLLEAIFFCTAGRSFRTARDKELVRWDREECFAGTELDKENSSLEITASVGPGGRTVFSLNGKRQNKNKIFQPCLSVSFTPSDLDLIKGSPSERRKWIDLDLGPFDVYYNYNLDKYQKVLDQRNNLLKTGSRGKMSELADPWNEQLVGYGSSIIYSRIRLLKSIFPHLRETYSYLTSGSGSEEISFNYLSSIPLERGAGPGDIRAVYQDCVEKRFSQEVERQQTLFGPHRDDLVFMLNGADVRKFGSRGQQRSVVLALKIALMRMFFEEYGEYPVLLLDDVFLELDRHRQKGLENLLKGEAQVFITTDRAPDGLFDGLAGTYTVDGGKILGGEE